MHQIAARAVCWIPSFLLAVTTAAFGATGATRPNILLIVSDDHGYADVGVNGCPDFATPHLDSIAQNGVRVTNGYVTAPQCAPSRCGLLTGRYQQRFGYEYNDDSAGFGLPLREITLANRLRAAGYVTGAIGKWHLGREEPFHPLNRGFSEFFGFLGGGHHYIPRPGGKAAPNQELWRNREEVPHAKYLTDQLGDEAVAFVGRHARSPWFLYLAFNAPHVPLQASPKYLARVSAVTDPTRKTYAAMVTALDENVGRVLEKVRSSGQEERTLVFFLSDNGGPLGGAWNGSSNAPFSGQKGDTEEGGIRVPFFVQWKGVLPAGKVFDPPVISLDIVPTVLAAAGSAAGADANLDGVNVLPALKGEAPLAGRSLYWRFNFPPGKPALYKHAIREGDWKLVKNWNRATGGEAPARLINLPADPAERADLRASEPQRFAALQARYDAWNAELKEPFDGAVRTKDQEKSRKERPRKREARK